jgi:TRAP-type C4-dicarboxylate transport system permease small subunit
MAEGFEMAMPGLREIGARGTRLARRLGHTLIAFSFFAMAAVGVFVSLEEWMSHRPAPADDWIRLSVFGGFTLFLVIMGLLSLLKARSVR